MQYFSIYESTVCPNTYVFFLKGHTRNRGLNLAKWLGWFLLYNCKARLQKKRGFALVSYLSQNNFFQVMFSLLKVNFLSSIIWLFKISSTRPSQYIFKKFPKVSFFLEKSLRSLAIYTTFNNQQLSDVTFSNLLLEIIMRFYISSLSKEYSYQFREIWDYRNFNKLKKIWKNI